jgi:hypothetical protein
MTARPRISTQAQAALARLTGAKRLLLGCAGNLAATRGRVLAWWSALSSIDASRRPTDNTRVVLVLGGGGGAAEELVAGLLLFQLVLAADVDLGDAGSAARALLRPA